MAVILGLRGALTRLAKPDFFNSPKKHALHDAIEEKTQPYTATINPRSSLCAADSFR